MTNEAQNPYGGTDETPPPPDGYYVFIASPQPPGPAGWFDAMSGVWRYLHPTSEGAGG
jgi:hypothetical protein